jgi:peroxiredoxin
MRHVNRAVPNIAAAIALSLASATALAASAGQTAPDFTVTDSSGAPVHLADFKGKFVVLEWTNPECPFVQKHYNSANMQTLQKEFGAKDVVWLTVNSTNESSSEYKTGVQMNAWMQAKGAAQKAVLIDGDSATGTKYAAKTTPHMFVIDPKGQIVYAGAIDDKRSTRPDDVKTATNYVRVALTESMAGKPVSTPNTTPYGCSVKY